MKRFLWYFIPVKYFYIKYTYKYYNDSVGAPRYEYELYRKILFFPKKFITITYTRDLSYPILKEVKK